MAIVGIKHLGRFSEYVRIMQLQFNIFHNNALTAHWVQGHLLVQGLQG